MNPIGLIQALGSLCPLMLLDLFFRTLSNAPSSSNQLNRTKNPITRILERHKRKKNGTNFFLSSVQGQDH